MSRAGWLQITDYSNKYRISVSTLRRRIKADEIEHVFEDGKYWLPDAPVDRYSRKNESGVETNAAQKRETSRLWEDSGSQRPVASLTASHVVATASGTYSAPNKPDLRPAAKVSTRQQPPQQESDALLVAREMVKEMKTAYVQILQEKEEQILQLKEEIADLRTLCRILESDNERLKSEVTKVSSVTNWLDDESGPELDL